MRISDLNESLEISDFILIEFIIFSKQYETLTSHINREFFLVFRRYLFAHKNYIAFFIAARLFSTLHNMNLSLNSFYFRSALKPIHIQTWGFIFSATNICINFSFQSKHIVCFRLMQFGVCRRCHKTSNNGVCGFPFWAIVSRKVKFGRMTHNT